MANGEGNGLTIEQPFPERPAASQLHDVGRLLAGEPLEDENDGEQQGHQAASTAEGTSEAATADEGAPLEGVRDDEGETDAGDGLGGLDLGEGKDLDVAAMATHLGVTEAELYTMQIPMGQDRGQVSFGQLKDAWRDQANVADRSDALTQQQNQLMGNQRTMQATMNMLADRYGAGPLQEAAAAAEADGERYRLQEQAATLERFPEWRDSETYQAARGGMLALATEYDFSEGEFTGVQDHRLVALLHDFHQLRARVGAAKKAAADARKGVTRKAQRPGGRVAAQSPTPKSQAIKDQAKRTGVTEDMTAAASHILSEQTP